MPLGAAWVEVSHCEHRPHRVNACFGAGEVALTENQHDLRLMTAHESFTFQDWVDAKLAM